MNDRARGNGHLQAAILDWAGTVADFGCLAPVEAFVELFRREGLDLRAAQAREPMGTEKKEHIRRLLALPAVRAQWLDKHGTEPDAPAIDRLYAAFLPIQIEAIRRRTRLIPGAARSAARLRGRGCRIGANTGYSRAMLWVLEDAARREGYVPDVSLASEDAPRGRPWPDLALMAALKLGVDAVQACVKVDDTVPGIEEGLAAGMWTIGVAVSGNEVGLALEDWHALQEGERQALRERAVDTLARAGAHYVVDTIADIDACIDDINRRLAAGQHP